MLGRENKTYEQLSTLQNLERFTAKSTHINAGGHKGLCCCTKLLELKFINCPMNYNEHFKDFSKLTNLQSFELSEVTPYVQKNVVELLTDLAFCTNLTKLNLGFRTAFLRNNLKILQGLTRLRNVSITCSSKFPFEDYYHIFSPLPFLSTLRLFNFPSVSVKSNEIHENETSIGFCTGLTNLDLTNHSTLKDQDIATVATNCSNLRTLNLSYCPKVTKLALQSLKGCRELVSLDLTGCIGIHAIGLVDLVAGCSNIKSLRLEKCSQITNKIWKDMIPHCLALEDLNLGECSGLDGNLLSSIQHFTNLTKLDVYNNEWVSDKFVCGIATTLTKLNHLNLNECSQVGNLSLQMIGEHLIYLEQLWLGLLPEITSKGLEKIAGCHYLNYLDVTYCKKIKVEHLEPVLKSCHHLDRIRFAIGHYANTVLFANEREKISQLKRLYPFSLIDA